MTVLQKKFHFTHGHVWRTKKVATFYHSKRISTGENPIKLRQCINNTNLDDNDSLLHDVVDFGLNEVKQRAHTTLGCLFHLDSTAADRTHGLPHKVNVDFRCIPEYHQHNKAVKSNHQLALNNVSPQSKCSIRWHVDTISMHKNTESAYTAWPRKLATFFVCLITVLTIDQLKKKFHSHESGKKWYQNYILEAPPRRKCLVFGWLREVKMEEICNSTILKIPPHIKCVATLPCEMSVS